MPGEGPRPDIESEVHKQRIAFIDATSGVDDRARDIAEARLIEEQDTLRQEGGFRNFFKRIWKSKMHEYYRVKEVEKAKQEIQTDKSLYVDESGSEMAHREAMGAVVERFVSEFEEDMVHQGEERQMLEGEQKVEVEDQIKDLIKKYASGEIDDDVLSAERARLFSKVTGVTEEQLKNQVGYADNLIAVAKEARRAVEHGKALDDLDLEFDFVVGKARTGARTEAQLHTVDRIVDGIKSNKFGRFFDETGLALTVAAVYSTAAAILPSVARSKMAAWATFGASALIGSGFAAARENKRLKEERALHGRQRATGAKFDDKSKRRAELEKYRHSTESAQNLLHLVEETELLRLWETKDYSEVTQEQIEDFVAKISEIDARVAFSDRNKIDLISYSSASGLEKERQQLNEVRAKGKAVIKAALASGKVAIDLGEHPDVDKYLESAKELRVNGFAESAEKNNRGFQRMKAKKVAWTATKALGIGLAIGTAVQEARAFIQPEEEGLIERMVQGHQKEHAATALESLRRWMTGETFSHHVSGEVKYPAGASGFPEGVDMVQSTDGTWTLQVDGNDAIKNLVLNPDGTIAEKSKQILENNGFFVRDLPSVLIEGEPITTETGAKQYIEQHPELFDEVKRKLWYDNNTPAPKFDKNELKLWWGGDKNAGLTETGDFVMDVKHMFPKGSFHGAEFTNAIEQFKNGSLKLLLSLSKDTHDQVVEIQIDSNGQAIIPKDSEIAKLFFGLEKGKAIFKGQYAEVAQMMGEKDGVDQVRLLATHVGKGVDGLPGEGPSPSTELHRWAMDRVVKSSEEIPDEWVFYPPPVIPYSSRKELEGQEQEDIPVAPVYPRIPERERELLLQDMSPRLREDPEAKLDVVTETDWYFKDQERRYPGYNDELKALSSQEGEPMGPEVTAVVALAVAGHQEHENIYRTLETYATQTDRSGSTLWKGQDSKAEILLYVNWPSGSDATKTFEEVERFKLAHPDIPIRMYKEEINNGKVEVGWYKKKIFDIALLRNQERGSDSDILIVANDADMTYSSTHYLEDTIAKMNGPKGEQFDALLGRQDLDPEVYKNNPTFHAIMRFWQFMESIMRSRHKLVGTQGRNTAMRASAYAAIGGNRTKDFWADIEFGQLLNVARNDRNTIGYANKAWVMVDPRREISKFKNGELLAYTWADFNERDNIRGGSSSNVSSHEVIDLFSFARAKESSPEVIDFKKKLEEEIQAIIDIFGPKISATIEPGYGSSGRENTKDVLSIIEKAGDFLGVKLALKKQAGKINIRVVNTKKLRQRLLEYDQKGGDEVKIKNHPLFNRDEAETSEPSTVEDIDNAPLEDVPPKVRVERWTSLMGSKGILQKVVDRRLLSAEEGKTIRKQLRKGKYDLVFTFLKEKLDTQNINTDKSRFKHLIDEVGRLGFTAHDAKRRIISSSERKVREGKRVQL